MWGSTTPRASATDTAASTALPPARRVMRPAWAASGWLAATAPRRPMISGRYDWTAAKADLLTGQPLVTGGRRLATLRDRLIMLLRRSSDAPFCASGAHGPKRPLRSGSRKARRAPPVAALTRHSAFSNGLL